MTIVSGLSGYHLPAVRVTVRHNARRAVFPPRGALNLFGDPLRAALKRYFGWFLLLIAVAVVVGFILATHVL